MMSFGKVRQKTFLFSDEYAEIIRREFRHGLRIGGKLVIKD